MKHIQTHTHQITDYRASSSNDDKLTTTTTTAAQLIGLITAAAAAAAVKLFNRHKTLLSFSARSKGAVDAADAVLVAVVGANCVQVQYYCK